MTSTLEVVLLGALQGLTEFLPVSSSGHLALGQTLLGIRDHNLLLSVTLHAGTLVATVLFFRERLGKILSAVAQGATQPGLLWRTAEARDAATIVMASIPTAIIGLTLKEHVEQWTMQPKVVGIGFLVTAVLLISTRHKSQGQATSIGVAAALLLGLMQGLAVLPGISRSGATIATLLWLGVSSARAFELSMLISLPPVLGAFLLESIGAFQSGTFGTLLLLGAGVSFFVGLVALHWLRGLVTQGRLAWFTWYLFPIALFSFLVSPEVALIAPK